MNRSAPNVARIHRTGTPERSLRQRIPPVYLANSSRDTYVRQFSIEAGRITLSLSGPTGTNLTSAALNNLAIVLEGAGLLRVYFLRGLRAFDSTNTYSWSNRDALADLPDFYRAVVDAGGKLRAAIVDTSSDNVIGAGGEVNDPTPVHVPPGPISEPVSWWSPYVTPGPTIGLWWSHRRRGLQAARSGVVQGSRLVNRWARALDSAYSAWNCRQGACIRHQAGDVGRASAPRHRGDA